MYNLRRLVLALALLAALLVACGGSSEAPSPTATPSPEPTPAAVDPGPPEPQLERILEHDGVLSERIGVRPAGSPAQDAAVDYARRQLEAWGYNVEVQDFLAGGAAHTRYATLTIEGPDQQELPIVSFGRAATGTFSGPIVDAGTARPDDFTPDARGSFVLVQRQDVPFADMVSRAKNAGAIGVVIANKEPGMFPAALEEEVDIPVVVVSKSDGELLRGMIAQGPVEVRVDAPAEVPAHNVIARPASGRCRVISGGHYDSVPWAAGANDNGSGASLVLELARASAAAGLSDRCFVLFGAEEGGLMGSKHFVEQLTPQERDDIEAFFNYDVVGSAGRVSVVGGGDLTERTLAEASALGMELTADVLPMGTGSDHISFLDAGIPAVLITTLDYGLIHTVNDTFANLVPDHLQDIARLAFALLQAPASAATPQARACPPLPAGIGSPGHLPHGGALANPSMACPAAGSRPHG